MEILGISGLNYIVDMEKALYNNQNGLLQNETDLTNECIKDFKIIYLDHRINFIRFLNKIGFYSISKIETNFQGILYSENSIPKYRIYVNDNISKRVISANGNKLIEVINEIIKKIHISRANYYEPFIIKRISEINLD